MAEVSDAATEGTMAQEEGSIKDTLISLTISLAVALTARSYVAEAFIIPTGSMAPTLRGAHMQWQSPETGYDWAVNPWYYYPSQGSQPNQTPIPLQGNLDRPDQYPPPIVTDPMTSSEPNEYYAPSQRAYGISVGPEQKRVRAGDRILVQKYLYHVFPPDRFDVIVFKNPEQATENYIKRLTGLPGETIWLADGDIFTTRAPIELDDSGHPVIPPKESWEIARKPDRVQRAVWHTLYSSDFAPLHPVVDLRRRFTSPWRSPDTGWSSFDERRYTFTGSGETTLDWDTSGWPITDWVPYNDNWRANRGMRRFPVADLRVRAGIEANDPGVAAEVMIDARGMQFRATFEDQRAAVFLRQAPSEGVGGEANWMKLGDAPMPLFKPGRIVDVEFCHFDQTLQVWIDDQRVLSREYDDMGPAERLGSVMNREPQIFMSPRLDAEMLASPEYYAPGAPKVTWKFRGGGFTLHRVGLDRDLYYQPVMDEDGRPGLATHPSRLPTLGSDEYFALGDNSPNSKDGRRWDVLDDEVRTQGLASHTGVVPRKLLLGKAFFVYFPAPHGVGRIPVPDFGRMRMIR